MKNKALRRPPANDRRLFIGRLLERKFRLGGPAYTAPQVRRLVHEHFAGAPYHLEKSFSEMTIRRDLLEMGATFNAKEQTWHYPHKTVLSEMKTDLLLSNHNTLAVMMAQKAVVQFKGTPLHGLLEPVLERMLAAMPADERGWQNLIDRIRITAPERLPIADDLWQTLCYAINDGTTLDMKYQSGFSGETKQRKVDPYALLIIGREWHLLAFDHLHQSVRVFQILRILEADNTGDFFKVQKGFNLDAYLSDTVLGYPTTDTGKVQVKLRFSKAGSIAGRTTVWHPEEKRSMDKEGRLTVSFKTSSAFFVAKEVLAWGGHVEVLEPTELRKQVREMAQKVLAGNTAS